MNHLHELEKTGKKIIECKLVDPNYDEMFHHYAVYNIPPYKSKIYVSNTRFRIEITGFKTELLFSINLRDKVCFIQNRINCQSNSLQLYGTINNSDAITKWYIQNSNQKLFSTLFLSRINTLVVYKNALVQYSEEIQEMDKRMADLYGFIKTIKTDKRHPDFDFNLDKIPDTLKPLFPFIKDWAISDDIIREEKIIQADSDELKSLLDIGVPLLNYIDEFISSFKEPFPDEVVQLVNLAETISEIQNAKEM